jgi:hypothetical protein
LGNLEDDLATNRALETVRGNIRVSAKESLGYYELKQHKPWFDEGCSELLDQKTSQITVVTESKQNKWE